MIRQFAVTCVVAAFAFIVPTNSNAASVYDGVWQIPGFQDAYLTISTNGNQLLLLALDARFSPPIWEASLGTITGNTATVETIIRRFSIDRYRIVFDSSNTATFTNLACTPPPGEACQAPLGDIFQATKIF